MRRFASQRPLLLHLAALCLAMVALSPVLELDAVFSSDEGSTALQARALREGRWDAGYGFRDADPGARFVPWHAATVTDSAVVPYAQHPLWSTAQHLSTLIAGERVGLRLLSAISFLAVAGLGWALAAELGGPRAGPWGFWIAAASPVLANAWGVWAHAPSAALGGMVVLGLLRVGRSRRWLAPVLIGTAGGVALRSEALLWSLAIAVSYALLSRGRRRWLGAAIALTAGATLVLERAWIRSVIPGTVMQPTMAGPSSPVAQDRASGAGVGGRLAGLRTALIDSSFGAEDVRSLGYVALATMVLAAVMLVRRHPGRAVPVSLAVVAVAAGARLLIAVDQPVPGLLAAAPIMVLGLAWRPSASERWLVGAVLLFVGAVAASIYTNGGGLQWGGRFLSPVVPLLAAMAAVPMARVHSSLRRADARAVVGAVAMVLVVQATGAVVVPDQIRRENDEALEHVRSIRADVVIGGSRHVGRFDFERWPDVCWLAVDGPPTSASIVDLLEVLRRSGVDRAAFIEVDPSLLENAGASVISLSGDELGLVSLDDAARRQSISSPYRC